MVSYTPVLADQYNFYSSVVVVGEVKSVRKIVLCLSSKNEAFPSY